MPDTKPPTPAQQAAAAELATATADLLDADWTDPGRRLAFSYSPDGQERIDIEPNGTETRAALEVPRPPDGAQPGLAVVMDQLQRAAAKVHEIAQGISARKLLAGPMNDTMRAAIAKGERTDDQVVALAADAFELIVRALATLGDNEATILECQAQDIDETTGAIGPIPLDVLPPLEFCDTSGDDYTEPAETGGGEGG